MTIIDVVSVGQGRFFGMTGNGQTIETIDDIINLKGDYLSPAVDLWITDLVLSLDEPGQLTLAGEKIWRWRRQGLAIHGLEQLWPLPLQMLCALGDSLARLPSDDEGKMYDCSRSEILEYTASRARLLQSGLDELQRACDEAGIELCPSLGRTSLVNALDASVALAVQLGEHRISDGHWRHTRRAYYGGRTECYRHGMTPPVVYADRNSSYPAEYRRDYPIGKMKALNDAVDAQGAFMAGKLGAYQVTVRPCQTALAPIPVRRGIHLYYPTGRIDGIYTSADIDTALSVDADVTFHQAWIWESSAPVLQPFLDKFAVTKTWSIGKWAKLFLNSLSGKLGATNETDLVSITAPGEYRRGWIPRDSSMRIWSRKIYATPRLSSPIIAAYITAYARQELFRIMNESEGLCYVDTDSVAALRLPASMPISDRIGDWKIEAEGCRFDIHAPKNYDIITESRKIKKGNKTLDTISGMTTDRYWIGNRVRLPGGMTRTPTTEEVYVGTN